MGLAFLDDALRYVRINAALAAMHGLPPAAHLGRTVREVLPALTATLEPALRRVVDQGESVTDLEVSSETPAAPGRPRHWLLQCFPVRAAAGPVLGVGVVAVDITERMQAAAALQASE